GRDVTLPPGRPTCRPRPPTPSPRHRRRRNKKPAWRQASITKNDSVPLRFWLLHDGGVGALDEFICIYEFCLEAAHLATYTQARLRQQFWRVEWLSPSSVKPAATRTSPWTNRFTPSAWRPRSWRLTREPS